MRPFESLDDFIEKTHSDIASTVALIKAGAFDEFLPRNYAVWSLCDQYADKKKVLNGRNLQMLAREGLWPQENEDLEMARRLVNATVYMKKLAVPEGLDKKEWYGTDKRMLKFFEDIDYPLDEEDRVNIIEWKNYQEPWLALIKNYLKEHQEEMLEKVNTKAVREVHNKYFADDDFAQWEIETMGLTFKEHPLKDVPTDCFDELPQEPKVANMVTLKTGRVVPLYKLTMLCGVVIAKDKLHHTITLLTSTGPVDVKFRKEQFAIYDAQISQVVGGAKKIIERSWFNRGNKLLIHGMRQDDQFIAKTYKNSKMKHTVYKILGFKDDGKLDFQKERKKGILEEDLNGDE